MLGLGLIQAIPEDISAYIGTGQMVNMHENETASYLAVLKEAKRINDLDAIVALEAIAPYPAADGTVDPKKNMVLQYHQGEYGMGTSRIYRGAKVNDLMLDTALASPEYTLNDIRYFFLPGEYRFDNMPQLMSDVYSFNATKFGSNFTMPMYFFLGRHDWQTASVLVPNWMKTIKAPAKQIVWFEDSAHSPMVDESKKFAETLLNLVRPVVISNEK
jgi:pimeloyl-ACP methyl ester carboxylesterase